jgi:hypothetical protein
MDKSFHQIFSPVSVLAALILLTCFFVSPADPFTIFDSKSNNNDNLLSWDDFVSGEEGSAMVTARTSYVIGGGPCLTRSDCDNSGNCVNGTCVCDKGYGNTNCQYEEKSKLVAFLLGFFVGQYGALRFYLGYTGDGVGKIILVVFGILLCCGGICTASIGGSTAGTLAAEKPGAGLGVGIPVAICAGCCIFLGFGSLFASWLWWIIDWGLVLSNNLNDADGYPLKQDL